VGVILLWLPVGAIVYVLLARYELPGLTRFTFSSVASYTLTTLLYFGLSVVNLGFSFYVIQVLLVLGL
jgi:hypothetical protein